jgi:hypothetical protein
MRNNRTFWSLLLILIGVLLLLSNLGLLPVNIWPLIWPGILIVLGLWILFRRTFGRGSVEAETISVPLDGAQKARVVISHGAGRIHVSGAAAPGQLLSGQFNGGSEVKVNRSRDMLDVDLRADVGRGFDLAFPWIWGPGSALDWTFGLSSEIPLSLEMKTGASELNLDLTQLRLTDLRLETGASSSDIMLPARAGLTRVSVEGGATSVKLRVPEGVAARVKTDGGLAEFKVDTARFPKTASGYESSNFDEAENKVEIRADVGLSSVSII